MRFSLPSRVVIGALAACTVSMVNPAGAAAQGSSSSGWLSSDLSSGSSTRSEPKPAVPRNNPWSRISEGLNVTMIGDLLGAAQPHVGLGAVDLGIMAPLGLGKEFAVVFGDSFSGDGFGQGEWMSPVGVVAELDANGRIVIKRPLNDGTRARQLIDYSHDDFVTIIPSDVINLGGTLYMQGMWNQGLGNVQRTQIWKSTDNGATWTSVGTTGPRYMNGMGNLISWEKGPDGYIYVVSSDFRRANPVYLSRFREQDIADRSTWEIYNPATGAWGGWGRSNTPILDRDVRAGEMSLRYIQGHWVLAMFNEKTLSIEVRVSEEIARDWNEIEPARVVVAGDGTWRNRQDANNFTQLYGGYIVPGSTLDNLDIVVSQWNTSDNSRYMSTQFNVKGLTQFYGIDLGSGDVSRGVADPNVVDVTESAVTQQTLDRLNDEQAMERAADIAVVPAG